MSIKSFFKNLFAPEPTLKFKALVGAFNVGTPVQEARKVIPEYVKNQIRNHKENKFAKCPGMFDLSQVGYIISAHVDIHIKANKQGCIIKVGDMPPYFQPSKMQYDIVEGLAPITDTVQKCVMKIPLPWAVFAKKGYSAHVLPATMHCEYLDKIFVYPGVVDYDKFFTVNFIFSPLKECEITIWAGTPLLQLIPFKRENITAVCGKATEKESDIHRYSFFSRKKNFYRKMFHSRKSYTVKQID